MKERKNLIKLEVKITFYPAEKGGLKLPVYPGYRPLLHVADQVNTSMGIYFDHKEHILPEEKEDFVQVYVGTSDYIEEYIEGFVVGKVFTFGETTRPLGEVVILEPVEFVDHVPLKFWSPERLKQRKGN